MFFVVVVVVVGKNKPVERFREKKKSNLDSMPRRLEEEEGDLQTCTSRPATNRIVVQAICPVKGTCGVEGAAWTFVNACVCVLVCVLHHETKEKSPVRR